MKLFYRTVRQQRCSSEEGVPYSHVIYTHELIKAASYKNISKTLNHLGIQFYESPNRRQLFIDKEDANLISVTGEYLSNFMNKKISKEDCAAFNIIEFTD